MTNLYCFGNGIIMPNPYTGHTWQTNNHILIYWYLCQPIKELLTFECHHQIETHVLITYRTYLSWPLYETYIIFFLLRLFLSPIIKVSLQYRYSSKFNPGTYISRPLYEKLIIKLQKICPAKGKYGLIWKKIKPEFGNDPDVCLGLLLKFQLLKLKGYQG